MKLLDSLPGRALHKLLFVEEDAGDFSIFGQAVNRAPVPVQEHMTRDAALAYWRKTCFCTFYATSHNLNDAAAMADRRIATIH